MARSRELLHVRGVACAERHCCTLNDQGEVWCFVSNAWVGGIDEGSTGMLGLPANKRPTQLDLPRAHDVWVGPASSCVLTDDGTWCWGDTWDLDTATLVRADEPRRLALPEGTAQLALARRHACARLASGSLMCWGHERSGATGRTGPGPHLPAVVATDVRSVSVRGDLTAYVTEDGRSHLMGEGHRLAQILAELDPVAEEIGVCEATQERTVVAVRTGDKVSRVRGTREGIELETLHPRRDGEPCSLVAAFAFEAPATRKAHGFRSSDAYRPPAKKPAPADPAARTEPRYPPSTVWRRPTGLHCGDGRAQWAEGCDGDQIRRSCEDLRFTGGTMGCDRCELDTIGCAPCGPAMSCTVAEYPHEGEVLDIAEHDGKSWALLKRGSTTSGQLVLADISDGRLGSVEAVGDKHPQLRGAAMTPARGGWLIARGRDFGVDIETWPPRGGGAHIETTVRNDNLHWLVHDSGARLLYGYASTPHPLNAWRVKRDGSVRGGRIVVWADGPWPSRFSGAAAVTAKGFALARSQPGPDGKVGVALARISLRGKVRREFVEDTPGRVLRIDPLPEGWTITTLVDQRRLVVTETSHGAASTRELATIEAAEVTAVVRRGGEFAALLNQTDYPHLGLLQVHADGIVDVTGIFSGDRRLGVLEMLDAGPLVAWTSHRFRLLAPSPPSHHATVGAPTPTLIHFGRPAPPPQAPPGPTP